MKFVRNQAEADLLWWKLADTSCTDDMNHWGTGAGPYTSGYQASNFGNNKDQVYYPHIAAGFLPITPEQSMKSLLWQWQHNETL